MKAVLKRKAPFLLLYVLIVGVMVGQIQGALIGGGVVLSAVLLPMAFFGELDRSSIGSFHHHRFGDGALGAGGADLHPALCATLKPIDKGRSPREGRVLRLVQSHLRSASTATAWEAVLKRKAPFLLLYVLIVGVMVVLFSRIPTAFLPEGIRAYCSPR